MAEKVKLSEDGSSIDFVQSDSLPSSLKKFRQSPEIEGFYRFIYENDLQSEAFDILDKIIDRRKSLRVKPSAAKAAPKAAKPTLTPAKPVKAAAAGKPAAAAKAPPNGKGAAKAKMAKGKSK